MDVQRIFEQARAEGLFTDYDFCVYGPTGEVKISGGHHVSSGARLFDIASLTKALTHLVWWKLFSQGKFSPMDPISRFLEVPNSGGRELWHFMSYLVQGYAFDYQKLKTGSGYPSFKGALLDGFGLWTRGFSYDNYSSAYAGMVLESIFGCGLEEIIHSQLCLPEEKSELLFHPVYRGIVQKKLIVPTRPDFCGSVHDPVSRSYQDEHLSVAGVFSRAELMARIFHRELEAIIRSGFYDEAAVNQLIKCGITDHAYAMGFDIPYPQSLDRSVENPLIFSGWTGCRLFFAKQPRVTFCYLTNRVFCEAHPESRSKSSQLFGKVIRQVLEMC